MTDQIMIKAENVSKEYRLGVIGGTTLREELQRLGARLRGRDDPTRKLGESALARGERFLALDGVSFAIRKGEAVGIIGHNGAGKSTLLKLITRVTAPSGGRIGLNGRVASMLEVGTGFHPELTGRENIYMNGAILGMSRSEIDDKLEQIVDFSEVRPFIDTPVKRYSSGMYVKLAFSVAAHLDSEIVIMDEVLAVGDMAFQKKCLDKMRQAATVEGRTVLYVSHNMSTIRQLCDRVIVLNKGKIVFDGGVEEGIEQYTKSSVGFQTVYDCFGRHTGYHTDEKLHIDTVSYPNKDYPSFRDAEPIELAVDYTASERLERLAFRVTVKTRENQTIGMAASPACLCAEKGKNRVLLRLNADALAPGKYCLKLVAFSMGALGANQTHDVVETACAFEKQCGGDSDKLLWNSSWWGHLMLPELTAEETDHG